MNDAQKLVLGTIFSLTIFGYVVMKATQKYAPRIVIKEVKVTTLVEKACPVSTTIDSNSFEAWEAYLDSKVPFDKLFTVEKKVSFHMGERFGSVGSGISVLDSEGCPGPEYNLFEVYIEDVGTFDVGGGIGSTDQARIDKLINAYFH